MAEPRRQTQSAGTQGREQSDAQFWSNHPDSVLIERGQTKTIQLVRNTVNPTMTNHTDAAASSSITHPSEPTEANMTDMSKVPHMAFVDNEGLEEQFLTGIRQVKKSWTELYFWINLGGNAVI